MVQLSFQAGNCHLILVIHWPLRQQLDLLYMRARKGRDAKTGLTRSGDPATNTCYACGQCISHPLY